MEDREKELEKRAKEFSASIERQSDLIIQQAVLEVAMAANDSDNFDEFKKVLLSKIAEYVKSLGVDPEKFFKLAEDKKKETK